LRKKYAKQLRKYQLRYVVAMLILAPNATDRPTC
jgi:hypothetical protein